jgi:hypothetical protein
VPEGLANPLERACACGRAGACLEDGWVIGMKQGGLGGDRRGWDLAREIAVGAKKAYCLADLS